LIADHLRVLLDRRARESEQSYAYRNEPRLREKRVATVENERASETRSAIEYMRPLYHGSHFSLDPIWQKETSYSRALTSG